MLFFSLLTLTDGSAHSVRMWVDDVKVVGVGETEQDLEIHGSKF